MGSDFGTIPYPKRATHVLKFAPCFSNYRPAIFSSVLENFYPRAGKNTTQGASARGVLYATSCYLKSYRMDWSQANVTLNDFLQRFATIRRFHKNWCNVTCRCEQFFAYSEKSNTLRLFYWSSKTRNDVARILSSQPVSAMGCYTGTIFKATSLQIVRRKSFSVTLPLRLMYMQIFSFQDVSLLKKY